MRHGRVLSFLATAAVACLCAGGCTGPAERESSKRPEDTFAERACPVEVSAALIGAVTCGTLTVPESRATGAGTVRLFVASLSPAHVRHEDAIVVVGTDLATSPNYAGIAPLAQRTGRRVVFLEQRGTAHSEPRLSCPPVSQRSSAIAWTDRTGSVQWRRKVARLESRCYSMLRQRGVDFASYDVTEMATDVADLIQALHLAPANVVSYGSTSLVTLQLMRNDSAALRAVIMDTPAVPGVDPRAQAVASTQRATARVLRWCEEDAACRHRYEHPRSLMIRALASLTLRPMSLLVDTQNGRERVTLDPALLVRVARQVLTDGGSAGRWGLPGSLPALFASVASRDYTTVRAALAELLGTQGPLCPGYRNKCMSGHVVDEAVWDNLLCREVGTAAPAAMDPFPPGHGLPEAYGRAWGWDPCAHWPGKPGHRGNEQPVTSDVPTLVTVGGLAGPASLPAVRRTTARLSNVSVVQVPTGSHNVLGDPCLSKLRNAWLDTLSPVSDRPACLARRLRWGP